MADTDDLNEIFGESRKPRIAKLNRSRIRDPQPKNGKFVFRLYDSEYELFKRKCKKNNVSMQKLLDYLVVYGFLKDEPRIIEFINECIKDENKFNTVQRKWFSQEQIMDLLATMDREEQNE